MIIVLPKLGILKSNLN